MIDEHHQNTVMMLQNRLATASMTFKDVLELRTQVHTFDQNTLY
jgi:syntaxin 5